MLSQTVELLIANLHLVPLFWDKTNNLDSLNDVQIEKDNLEKQEFILSLGHAGYRLDEKTTQKLLSGRLVRQKEQLSNILDAVYNIKNNGNTTEVTPLFSSFPNYHLTDNELKILNLFHYLTGARYVFSEDDNIVDKENVIDPNLVELVPATYEKVEEFLFSFLTSSTPKSDVDRELVRYLLFDDNADKKPIFERNLLDDPQWASLDKSKISPLKENLMFMISEFSKYNSEVIVPTFSQFVSNPVDVLRLAYNMNNKDLKKTFNVIKFKFSRPQLRILYELFEKVTKTEDLSAFKHYELLFKLLGKTIHPTTSVHNSKYPNTYKAFIKLMNNDVKGNPDYRAYHELLNRKYSYITVADTQLFYKTPTLMLKNLYAILLKYQSSKQLILDTFSKLIDKKAFSPLALMQAYRVFANPNYSPLYMIKNMYVLPDVNKVLQSLPVDDLNTITNGILRGLGELRPKDDSRKVYIDPSLDKITLPVNERITSEQFAVLPRLSRIPLPEGLKNLRTFVYWRNGVSNSDEYFDQNRIDLDSSLTAISDDKRIEPKYCSWNSSLTTLGMKHSGDITDANPNAVEYQDIDLDTLRAHGYKYVSLSVVSYTGQKFSDMFTASVGFMGINKDERLNSNTWTPKNVLQNMQLTSSSKHVVALIVDLQNNEIIWVNTPINKMQDGYSVYDDGDDYSELINRIINTTPLTIKELANVYFKDDLVDELPEDEDERNEIVQYNNLNENKVIDYSDIFQGIF